MTPKDVKFALGQIECYITHKIVSRYIKGLEQMLAENAKTISQHEELLSLQQSEIEDLMLIESDLFSNGDESTML